MRFQRVSTRCPKKLCVVCVDTVEEPIRKCGSITFSVGLERREGSRTKISITGFVITS